jgi:Ras-related protein Rab-4B
MYELAQAYDFLLKMIIIGELLPPKAVLIFLYSYLDLLGESNTGKSCLLHQFIHNSYKDNSAHTIGVEYSSRIVKIGTKNVKLQLWDTAGQERFR